jgi:hypothetical protein
LEPPTLPENSGDSDDLDYQPFQVLQPYLIGKDKSASGSIPTNIFDSKFSLWNQSEPFMESPQIEQASSSDSSLNSEDSENDSSSQQSTPSPSELEHSKFHEKVLTPTRGRHPVKNRPYSWKNTAAPGWKHLP